MPSPALPLLNRELSWLAFNERVLEEAYDERWPLLERLKFLAISETNLDEFFMIRVSGLLDQLSSEIVEPTDDGLPTADVLSRVRAAVQEMEKRQISCLVNDLLPKLAAAGISILTWTDLNEAQREASSAHFRRNVLPDSHAARRGSRAPVPLPLESLAEPRGRGEEHRDGRDEVCARQGAAGHASPPAPS